MLRWIFYSCFVILFGCALGPDFHSPHAPKTKQYTSTPTQVHTVKAAAHGGEAQTFVAQQDIPAAWWRLFKSESLNQLIEQGLKNSPDLESRLSTLRQTHEQLRAEFGATMLPSVDSQFLSERQRSSLLASGLDLQQVPGTVSPVQINTLFNLFNASVGVSYNLDLFGKARRHMEALGASVEYQGFQLQAANLTLTANIVTTAITIASLKAQLEANHKLILSHQKQLNVMTKSYHLGHVSRLDIISEKEALKTTEAKVPPLKTTLAKQEHALAALMGELPSEARFPYLRLSDLHLPTQLPVSLPSALIQQRPDIRSAEALLHKASAEVGVATADLFPVLNLSANYGYAGSILSSLFQPANKVWDYAGQFTFPLFHGGQLIAKRKAAIAAYEYSYAQYRKVVIEAFQDVADVLRALEYDAELLKINAEAVATTQSKLKIIQVQYDLGKVNYSMLLTTKQKNNEAQINLIKAQATRFADTAALFQALGGGWWNAPTRLVKA